MQFVEQCFFVQKQTGSSVYIMYVLHFSSRAEEMHDDQNSFLIYSEEEFVLSEDIEDCSGKSNSDIVLFNCSSCFFFL